MSDYPEDSVMESVVDIIQERIASDPGTGIHAIGQEKGPGGTVAFIETAVGVFRLEIEML